MRRAAKVDTNHAEVVNALRAAGATVKSTASLGKGFPDLVVGWRNRNWLMEVKTETGKLTADESRFFDEWGGMVWLVRSPDDALKVIGAI